MSILTATVTKVKIGPLSIEGLMDENGDFAIALPQAVDLNLIPPNRSAKQLKALTGMDFQTHKLKTDIHPKAINAITIDTFQSMIRVLDKKGNEAASQFVDALLGLSLHQLFCDAFNIKFEAEDRQRWLHERNACRHDFRPLTDQLQRHGFTTEYGRYIWAMQAKVGMKSGERDSATTGKLTSLNKIQTRLIALMECDVKPWEALRRC